MPLQARRLADVTLSMLLLCPGLATEGSGGKEAKLTFAAFENKKNIQSQFSFTVAR